MATTLKAQMSKFMIALAMAVVASLFCVGSAFADVTVNVTMPDPNSNSGGTITVQDVQLDQSGIQNSTATPVTGMFYKSNAWNVLVTGTATNQYASLEKVIEAAVNKYNDERPTGVAEISTTGVWGKVSQNKLSLTATDGTYTKYYPQGADLLGTSSGNSYFYDLATNANTTLLSTLRSSSGTYALTSTLNGHNPNGVGPVFAWKYGADAATTTEVEPEDEDDDPTYVYETAGAAAQRAATNIEESEHPRLIMGCQDNWTTSDAMGKRYCTNITGITLS